MEEAQGGGWFGLVASGWAAGASFGPVNLMLAREGLESGLRRAVPFALGAWAGDVLLLVGLAMVSVRALSAWGTRSQGLLGLLGSFFLLFFALSAWRKSKEATVGRAPGPMDARTAFVAFGLTTLSPFGWVLWSGIAIRATTGAPGWTAESLYLIAAGDLIWFALFVPALCLLRSVTSEQLVRVASKLSTLVLVVLGIGLLIWSIGALWR